MWIAIAVLCGAANISTCYLSAKTEGYETKQECNEAIADISEKAEEANLGGLGRCLYVKKAGKDA